jgi:hypothetical protein
MPPQHVVDETGPVTPGAPVATILPGRGYGPQAPLLHYTRFLLRHRGWAVRTVRWERVPDLDPSDAGAVAAVADEVLADAVANRDIVIGKSLGSLALSVAAERGLSGVWYTPLLAVEAVRRGAARAGRSALLIGGTADPYWDGAAATATGATVFEVSGVDHSLERPGDLDATLAALTAVLARVTEHLDVAPGRPRSS